MKADGSTDYSSIVYTRHMYCLYVLFCCIIQRHGKHFVMDRRPSGRGPKDKDRRAEGSGVLGEGVAPLLTT